MRIKKIYQGTIPSNKIVSTYTETNTDTYSCEYLNDHLGGYPVGAIYISTNSTSPASLFGGTWERFGNGRTLVGVDTSQTEFNTVEKTGGSKTVTLTEGQLPNIQGTLPHVAYGENKITGHFIFEQGGNTHYEGQAASVSNNSRYRLNFGNNESHNNLPPYITVYMWKRVS